MRLASFQTPDGPRVGVVEGAELIDVGAVDPALPHVSVPRIIRLISEIVTLEPGDIIATGTPAGVDHARNPPLWMKPGDAIEIEIESIDVLRNAIVDEA